ncbi:uncharacterized protein METZ01_LOCUS71461 [marine metagenome]|uniref:Uncharacterized protein n=1 Tax=marine metagenome TaxID=408172 RepID=A0A381TUI3_9ZZZZ
MEKRPLPPASESLTSLSWSPLVSISLIMTSLFNTALAFSA